MGLTLHGHGHGHSHGGGLTHSHSHGHTHEEDPKRTTPDGTTVPMNIAQSHHGYGAVSELPDPPTREAHVAGTDTGAPTSPTENPRRSVVSRTISVGNHSSASSLRSVHLDLENGEGDSQESPPKKHQGNINVRAAFIHVIGDLIQSIGILIAAFIIYYKPEWKIVDPICTFIFSVLVLFTTISILRDTLNVLMEGTPRGISFKEVKHSLCSIEGVKELHNLRLWSLTMNKTAVSVHLALDEHGNAQHVLAEAGLIMTQKYGVFECTVQIEDYVDDMTECTHCQEPKD